MAYEHSIQETINMLDKISHHLNPLYEPKVPNDEETAVCLSCNNLNKNNLFTKKERVNVS